MDSDLARVNGKSGIDKADAMLIDAFQRSIILEAIYHFNDIRVVTTHMYATRKYNNKN